jgi:ubiquinone biosynthesis protein UbiJ
MPIRDLALEGLQQTINGVLGLDPQARDTLAGLHGRVVRQPLVATAPMMCC